MTVRVYRSTDAGAPVLSGSAGALIALLDACLVNGYGTTASAGWTKPFSTGATVAAYRQGGGNRFYLKVTDATTTYYATAWGYESMTDISTGVNPFPTDVQRALGSTGVPYISKSGTADSTAIPWIIIASDRAFYLINNANRDTSPTPGYQQGAFFGDIASNKAADKYGTLLMCTESPNSNITNLTQQGQTLNAHYLARSWHQLGNSSPCGKYTDNGRARAGALPSITDGVFQAAPYTVYESSTIPRGTVPGLWCPIFNPLGNTFVEGQQYTFTAGDLAGKTFEVHYLGSTPGYPMLFEISNTW